MANSKKKKKTSKKKKEITQHQKKVAREKETKKVQHGNPKTRAKRRQATPPHNHKPKVWTNT